MRKAPEWLADFQKSFGVILRTPLENKSGTLTSALPASWTELGILPRSKRMAAAGLSDYHRQYWFRLLTVLQKDFSLTARLMGLWTFNQWAQRYLLEVPPRAYDLGILGQHFADFLQNMPLPAEILQAARLDQVRAEVFMAPDFQPWLWEMDSHREPGLLRLRAAPDWRIFREDWALVDLCLRLDGMKDAETLPSPKVHQATRTWLIQRDEKGLIHRPLPAAQGQFYELLSEKNLQDALVSMEAEIQSLPESQALVQRWMADSMRWRLWAAA
jgi:hypothetical protein